jgi:hypothetical protein
MPIAAHTTGGHSTLDTVVGIAILLWALASVSALLSWLTRLARRHRRRTADHRRSPTGLGRLRRRRRVGGDADSGHAEHARATMTAVEHDVTLASDPPPSAAIRPRTADDMSRAVASSPSAVPGPRYSPETLEPLAQNLDTSHRLALAEARVAETLAGLPPDRWLVERYVLIAGHRIPFLALGDAGVFVICALTGPPAWDELRLPAQVAEHVSSALPGYTGPMRVGLCRPLAPPGIEPRWWCRPGEPGAWVMGPEWLIPWIEHFEPGHGLSGTDLEQLRQLANAKPGPVARVADVVPDLD